MFSIETFVGLAAAALTAASNVPQVRKAWQTRSTADLSLWMILLLATGLSLWIAYGILQGDFVIVLANSVSLMLAATLLYFKLSEA